MFISEYRILWNQILFGIGSIFRIRFSCEKLQVINLFNCANQLRWDASFWLRCYNGVIFSRRPKLPWLRACFLFLKTTRNDSENENEKFRETDEALQNENIQKGVSFLIFFFKYLLNSDFLMPKGWLHDW